MEISRRTVLKTFGGLVLATTGGLVLPNEAQAVDVSIRQGSYTREGVRMSYTKPSSGVFSESGDFRLYVSNDGKTWLDNTEPSVGFGNERNYNRVRAGIGDKKGEIYIEFEKGTKHGGFDIRGSRENVGITIEEGEISVHRQKNWRLQVPVLIFDGKGTVTSGSNIIFIDGRQVRLNSQASSSRYRGSTPVIVRPKESRFEYHFQRGGGIVKRNNSDFKRM